VLRVLPILLLATVALAQDVYVPPVPIGIRHDGKVRKAKSPIPFPDERGTWIRIRSAHYDVLSNASEEQTRGIVGDLETLASTLTKTSTRFRSATVPTTVLVFADRKESEPYFELLLGRDNPAATGLYVRHAAGGTMFIDASRRKQRIEKTAMHELVHDLLHQSEPTPPHWLDEGLAEYFSNGEIRDGKIIAGLPIRAHAALVRKSLPLTLERMFAVRPETDESMTPQFYAQSWAAVDWLMRTDRDRFFPFLEDIERGASIADALRTHYGKTLRDMETGIRASATASRQIELTGTPAEVPAPAAFDRATLLFELGRFLSYVAGAEEDSQRHYREALRVDPHHARTLAALGRFDEAIAAGLNDPEVHLAYAETLLTTALGPFAGIFEPADGDTEKFRKARTLAERALALGAGEGSARAALGTTYFVETDLGPGIAQLERAHALLPKRSDVALNLYAMLLRTQQVEKAEALYAEVFANAHDQQVAFAAKNVRVVAETSRANTLAKAGKLDEAAALVRALAAATEDAVGRRELEQQAASLESVAAVNRHISMYNNAIALANTGRNRDAMKVLDELLSVVKDPQVARDAKKFRDELRKR
jgi:tetratricopeptide (TPR) repeat protein